MIDVDKTTDQNLTVLECRALLATLFSAPVAPPYRATLRKLARKVARGAANETPEETEARHEKRLVAARDNLLDFATK